MEFPASATASKRLTTTASVAAGGIAAIVVKSEKIPASGGGIAGPDTIRAVSPTNVLCRREDRFVFVITIRNMMKSGSRTTNSIVDVPSSSASNPVRKWEHV